jgi:hypothetical protein
VVVTEKKNAIDVVAETMINVEVVEEVDVVKAAVAMELNVEGDISVLLP